jgi:hypothetical protein
LVIFLNFVLTCNPDSVWFEGKATYGEAFRPYDYFVVKHATAGADSRGEQGHFGDYFVTFHAAMSLELENSLLAIDQSI